MDGSSLCRFLLITIICSWRKWCVKCVFESSLRSWSNMWLLSETFPGCTCPGLDGLRGLAPPPRVDGHNAQPVVCVRLELHHGARGAAHHRLREEVPSARLCPQDVAGRPGNLCELHSDAVAVFGVGLFNGRYFRSWMAHDTPLKTE